MPKRFTIVGGRGFIGSALAGSLRSAGHDVSIVAHRDDLAGAALHHVVYASGIAASSADDPGYAFAAHVGGAERILTRSSYDSFLYLSSTRVYGTLERTDEGAPLIVAPGLDDVYRISKIAGEALTLANASPAARVARLSNVAGASYESPLFLSDVLRQAAHTGRADVRTQRASAKDYISIDDVCRYVTQIALGGGKRIYNVAAGTNIENGAIYDVLERLGIAVAIEPAAALARTPVIAVRRLHDEFGPAHDDILALVPELLARFRGRAGRPV